jgi:hypothetical protein
MHKDFGVKMSLDFRKTKYKNEFHHLEINTSPHYHFNNYLHNGNDFTPSNAIESVIDILTYLRIKQREYNELKVVNIEFGLNIVPETDIKNLINGLYFYKKTPFKIGNFPYFKKTDATSYKQIKAYAKGLQFLESPQYGIHSNTFRFEVKTKQSKNIRKYGINTATDLLNLETYNQLGQTLLDEWKNTLLTNQTSDLSNLKPDEVQFIINAKNFDFWNDMIQPKYRNKFGRYKDKYYSSLKTKNNLHHLIKLKIIDKLINLQSGANSTQKTPINWGKVQILKTTSQLINLESAPPHQNNSVCLVTKLDISMQRKGSKYLCLVGLKYYKENEPEIYKILEEKYLTEDKKNTDMKTQFYYLAHCIRNVKTNIVHNRKRFENRNYNKQQLQFNF